MAVEEPTGEVVASGEIELTPPRDLVAPPLKVEEWVTERVPPSTVALLTELRVGAKGDELGHPLKVAPGEVDAEDGRVGVTVAQTVGTTEAVGERDGCSPVLVTVLDPAKDTLPPPFGVAEGQKEEEREAPPLALLPSPPKEMLPTGDWVPSPVPVPLMDPEAVGVESSPVEDTHTEL